MLTINPLLYQQLADLLFDAIDGRGFYSDYIEMVGDDADYRFSATLMIYYKEHIFPEGACMLPHDIIPVWWEFHSVTDEGEVLNDFDFNILKDCICQ